MRTPPTEGRRPTTNARRAVDTTEEITHGRHPFRPHRQGLRRSQALAPPALAQGGTGLATGALGTTGLPAAAAQDATPEPAPGGGGCSPTMLFVQTFQSGTIVPTAGVDGRFTLTLEAGSGQTVYFSDRPDRVVGSSPTPQFLDGLGFLDDNPPNAALVVESAPGVTDVAVVELFAPRYDPVGQGVTYEAAVLANWETSLDLGFTEAPTDLAALAPSLGSAHLFIDDCPDSYMYCVAAGNEIVGDIPNWEHHGFCYSWAGAACLPCQPWEKWVSEAYGYWGDQCNQRFPRCNGKCQAQKPCYMNDWDFAPCYRR